MYNKVFLALILRVLLDNMSLFLLQIPYIINGFEKKRNNKMIVFDDYIMILTAWTPFSRKIQLTFLPVIALYIVVGHCG